MNALKFVVYYVMDKQENENGRRWGGGLRWTVDRRVGSGGEEGMDREEGKAFKADQSSKTKQAIKMNLFST